MSDELCVIVFKICSIKYNQSFATIIKINKDILLEQNKNKNNGLRTKEKHCNIFLSSRSDRHYYTQC